MAHLFTSTQEAKRIIQEFKPDVCMGTGGYVSGPVIREAMKLGIPSVIHEQNAYPGVTNKALSKRQQRQCLPSWRPKSICRLRLRACLRATQ